MKPDDLLAAALRTIVRFLVANKLKGLVATVLTDKVFYKIKIEIEEIIE